MVPSTHQSITMCYHQPYQLWWILLILFLLLELCSSVCYHGTCDVECHCHSNNDCTDFDGDYTGEFDVCRSGCDPGWEGIGCQIGNVAEGKEASQTDWRGSSFNGDNSAGNCVDGGTSRLESHNSCCGVAAYSHWEVSLGDMYVVNQLKLHRSENDHNSVRNTNIRLYSYDQLVQQLHTGTSTPPPTLTLNLDSKVLINRIEVQKNSERWFLRMCEVEAFGYQYKECAIYNSMYYYGPGCLQNCYCQEQCDYITGECLGTCMAGYQHDSDDVCVLCDEGTWGAGCSKQCHCRDQDVCDHVNGTCPNGCPDVYTSATCQQLSLRESDITIRSIGKVITVAFPYNIEDFGFIIQFQTLSQSVREHTLLPTSSRQFTYELPLFKQNYTICIIPVLDGTRGESSQCQNIFTQCEDRYYGIQCDHQCTCKNRQEVCEKQYGICSECPEGYIEDCKTALPTENEVHVVYTPGINEITIDVSLYSNISNYELIRTEGICHNSNGNHKVETSSQTAVISNLDSGTEYMCYVIPYIQTIVMNHQYTGNAIYSETVMTMAGPGSTPVIAIVVSVLVVVIVAVIVSVVIVYLIRRRRHAKDDGSHEVHKVSDLERYRVEVANQNDQRKTENGVSNVAYVKDKPPELNADLYENMTDLTTKSKQEAQKGISIEKLRSYIEDGKSGGKFSNEYSTLPTVEQSTDAGNDKANKLKHRFHNIKAFDHSRVILPKIDNSRGSDYINASYIRDYRGEQSFIASQAPRVCTIDDMWRMIWQEHINVIVMLTKLKEGETIKCQQYWPDSGCKDYRDIRVESLSTNIYSFYIERHWNVTRDGATRSLTHIQYTNWPDHSVPDSPNEILYLYYKVKALERSGPLLVHCSAGVGRTGTFIGLDILLDQCAAEKKVDVYGCVSTMREDRCQMVQSEKQYIFLHEMLFEAVTIGNTLHSMTSLKQTGNGMRESSTEGVSQIELLHKNIDTIYPSTVKDSGDSLTDENKDKNRSTYAVPESANRLYLSCQVKSRNDYINAVRCDSFKKKNAFILTQVPLTDTVVDLWRLVADHGVHGIVLLNTLDDEQPYWPKEQNEKMMFGPLNIQLIKETSDAYDGIVIRDFQLKNSKKSSSNRTVRQWQLTDWKDSQDMFDNVSVLNVLVDLVSRYQTQLSEEQTIIVQCMDGVRRCGMYVVYNNSLEMLQCTQHLDIGFAVKQVKLSRPQSFTNFMDLFVVYNWLLSSDEDEYQTQYYNNI